MKIVAGTLEHRFFDYLEDVSRSEIIIDVVNKVSHIIFLLNDKDEVLTVAVIDIIGDRVHVREMSGNIPKGVKYIEQYCELLTTLYKKGIISFCAKRKVIQKIGAKMGYQKSEECEDFEKRVNHE